MATSESRGVRHTISKTVSHSATTVALNSDIESLTISKGTVEPALAKDLYDPVIAILTFVRDELIEEDSFVKLADLCSRTCHVLETVDDLGSFRDQVTDLGRIVGNIESAVRTRANCATDSRERLHMSTEECVDTWRKELGRMLSFFDGVSRQDGSPGLSGVPEREHVQKPLDSELGSAPGTPVTYASGSFVGKPVGPPNSSQRQCDKEPEEPAPIDPAALGPKDMNPIPEQPPVLISDSDKQLLQYLISSSISQGELYSIIVTIVSNVNPTDISKCLERSDDAQTFIDVMDQALETIDFTPEIRRKCVRSLYKMCAGHTLLPKSLHFELPGGTMGDVQYKGGSADVLKREFGDGAVAIKALRPRAALTLEEMTNRFCKEVITWKAVQHPNVLPLLGVAMSENQFFMFSEWMANGNIKEFIEAHLDANRFQLLEDVARGLIHMHGQGMVHGDLKGANILIDRTGHACLTDFGLLTITSGTNITSSNSFRIGGTFRWMSPELFDPEMFNVEDSRPTKSSDRYAFGMVIYEVLSGQLPFQKYPDLAVVARILKGERPVRPQRAEGMLFTDGIWSILECCWKASPGDRPKIKDVLHSLEQVSRSWAPPPPRVTADPDTSMTWDPSESCTEGNTDESSLSSASRMVPPQSSQRLEREALSDDASGHRALGTTLENIGGPGATEQTFGSAALGVVFKIISIAVRLLPVVFKLILFAVLIIAVFVTVLIAVLTKVQTEGISTTYHPPAFGCPYANSTILMEFSGLLVK